MVRACKQLNQQRITTASANQRMAALLQARLAKSSSTVNPGCPSAVALRAAQEKYSLKVSQVMPAWTEEKRDRDHMAIKLLEERQQEIKHRRQLAKQQFQDEYITMSQKQTLENEVRLQEALEAQEAAQREAERLRMVKETMYNRSVIDTAKQQTLEQVQASYSGAVVDTR